MKTTLHIDDQKCIMCGKCVRVCPSGIFVQEGKGGDVRVEHPGNCIGCGHCVAVCPTVAVVHPLFPDDKVHDIDRAALPSPEQVMLLIKSRRSNRAFSRRRIPDELLDLILEAAHRAPTASNRQKVGFTLVSDPEKLHAVSSFTMDVFGSMARRLGSPLARPFVKRFLPDVHKMLPRFGAMKSAFDNGNDIILRGATALILIHSPKGSRFGCQDCNLAYQNASLMAESLGVAQFYTGFVCAAIGRDNDKHINKLFGIEGRIYAGIALGIPEFSFPRYIDRAGIDVRKFV